MSHLNIGVDSASLQTPKIQFLFLNLRIWRSIGAYMRIGTLGMDVPR